VTHPAKAKMPMLKTPTAKKICSSFHIFRSQKGAYLYILQSHKNAMGK
jgi:hypothetical protein